MQKSIVVVLLIIVVLFGGFTSYTPQPVKARDEICNAEPAPDDGEPIYDCGFVGDVQVVNSGPSWRPDLLPSQPVGPIYPTGGTGEGGSGYIPPVRTPGSRMVCTGQDTPALTCYEIPPRITKACPSFLRVVLHGVQPTGAVVLGISTILAASGPPGWIIGAGLAIGGGYNAYTQLEKLWEERRQCQEEPQPPL